MHLDWKPATLALLAAVTLLGAGCSGINSSQSVSPATFLIPGYFGQMTPAPSTPSKAAPAEKTVQTLAHAN